MPFSTGVKNFSETFQPVENPKTRNDKILLQLVENSSKKRFLKWKTK